MKHREHVAHHEAAHVLLAVLLGAGVIDHGIDLDAPTSADGAYGNAGVNIFDHDPDLPRLEQQADLLRNLCIVCAGAASDAKIKGTPLREALRNQSSDESVAKKLLEASPLIEKGVPDKGAAEMELVINGALSRASKMLDGSQNWKTVQEIAQATLDSGGKLAKLQIEEVIARVADGDQDRRAKD